MKKLTKKQRTNRKQIQFVLMLFVGFIVVAFLTGCNTFEETFEAKMLEMQQQHITEWHEGVGITNEIKSES